MKKNKCSICKKEFGENEMSFAGYDNKKGNTSTCGLCFFNKNKDLRETKKVGKAKINK